MNSSDFSTGVTFSEHAKLQSRLNCPSDLPARPNVDVGVVIPVYNRTSIVLGTLNSVNLQTVLPQQVVVVDDGSTDDTVTAVENWYRENQPNFQFAILRQAHSTASAARNLGMRAVRDCSLVAFLDSDDKWPTDFLARSTSSLKLDPSAIAATADRKFVNAFKNTSRCRDSRSIAMDPIAWLFRYGAGIASCTLFRKIAIEEAGGWDESLDSCEDAKLFVKVALAGNWKYISGKPTDFSIGHAAIKRQEGNLSSRYLDSHRRWAIVYESLYDLLRGHYPESKRRKLQPLVAKYWYRSGRILQANGHLEDANSSFARALEWNPWLVRAYVHRFAAA